MADITRDTRTIWQLACEVVEAWKTMKWTVQCRTGGIEQAAEDVRRGKAVW